MEERKFIIEIATSDFTTTAAAVEGGADRVELCANLAEGGTTPSYGMIRKCRETFSVQLYPIIRVRGGDFLYTPDELEVMLRDVAVCKDLGCDGIVVGMLNAEGGVDLPALSRVVENAYPLGVTFHRAFDRCRDPFEAIGQLIDAGCERVLTSGQQPDAPAGVALIAELNKVAGDRIIVMPGSGVRKENIKWLMEETGCSEFHSSLRGKTESKMNFIHPAFAGSAESYSNNFIDASEVRALRESLL